MNPNRKAKKHKQKRINTQLKKKLFGHLFISPCYYCKEVFIVGELTIEHIIPLCLNGTNESNNIALACQPCNHSRGRQSWFQKQEINRKNYEQYPSQYRNKNRSLSVQDTGEPTLHCEGKGI